MKTKLTNLEIRKATIPFFRDFRAIKLSAEEALNFDPESITSIEEVIEKYGNKPLKENTFYDGYIAMQALSHIEIVHMRGAIIREDPEEAKYIFDLNLRQHVAAGEAFRCIFPYKGKILEGMFNYVWTFRGMQLQRHILELKKRGYCKSVSPLNADRAIKDKLCLALTKEQTFSLSDEEDFILRSYLGNYYYFFFEK